MFSGSDRDNNGSATGNVDSATIIVWGGFLYFSLRVNNLYQRIEMKPLFRNFLMTLLRFKLASQLNILGLSVAFAAFIMLMIQVRYERTFDTVYKKTGRIYRVESTLVPTEASLASRQSYTSFCARPLMEMMLPSVPQIASYVIMHSGPSEMYVKYETGEGELAGMIVPFRRVSAGMPEVFDMEILEGVAASLAEPGKALIPESLARQMFGRESAIGRQIAQTDGTFFTIGGVYKDYPENTSIVNDMKISLGEDFRNDWTDWALLLYVVLAEDASPEEAAAQFADFFEKTGMGKQMGLTEPASFRLNPIEDIYYCHDTVLDIAPKGNRVMTYVLLSIALLVVAIAAVNFLNFSMALTPARIRSINIQKVLGESVAMLRMALVFEALGICLIAYLLALGWVLLFNAAGLSSILLTSVNFAGNREILLQAFFLAVIVGIIAGIYPAIYMTSFRPVFVLKGAFGMSPSGSRLRIVLTGFQFVISTGLIIAALFIWLQNRYMLQTDGFLNNSRIAMVKLDKDMIPKHTDVLIGKLKSAPSVSDVAFSDWGGDIQDYYPYTYNKSPQGEDIKYYFLPVSYNFTALMGLEITEGRDFEKADVAAGEERLVMNELAARQFNLKPGDRLANGSVIVGVVKDFHFMSLRKKIEPVALTLKPFQNNVLQPTLYIRTVGNAHRAIDQIKAAIAAIDPLYPVDVRFYDRQFEEIYRKERKTSSQITLFGLLAVILSLMGVFGLVTFETQYRRREISIRKVMGASVSEVLVIFNKRFMRITLVAFLLAMPVAWYGVEQWLQSFAYRTAIHWWVFVLAFVAILLITLITVTLQSWQVAVSNPVHSLKSE